MSLVYFETHGNTQAKAPTVVLSSGLGGATAYWRHQLDALVEQGLRVVLYDQRGTGRSAGRLPPDYAIAHMAEDVEAVLDALDVEKCHFVGHALGGLVGLELAAAAPARVASLFTINAWASVRSATARCFEARLALLEHAGAAPYANAQPIFLYPAQWIDEHRDEIEEEVRHVISNFPDVANLHARIAALRKFDMTSRLGSIKVPTLACASLDDVLVPWIASRDLVGLMPDARLLTIGYGGHAVNVTQPAVFNKALCEFFRSGNAD